MHVHTFISVLAPCLVDPLVKIGFSFIPKDSSAYFIDVVKQAINGRKDPAYVSITYNAYHVHYVKSLTHSQVGKVSRCRKLMKCIFLIILSISPFLGLNYFICHISSTSML